jgi:N-acetylglucosaminyl-diphospho-decaprenol L-rhamnosyltransferase
MDIAFITVSYNTLPYLKALAEFFAGLNVPFTYSFTVVDNGSQDGSREFLQSCDGVNYLQSGKNIGYGRALNLGVSATTSKYVCITNTDVVLNREALIALWRFLQEREDAGLCAPRITYADGRDQGMVFRSSIFAHYANWFAKIAANRGKRRVATAKEPLQVEGVMGAFFLIRRTAMPRPALFDEEFFFFYEDSVLAHTLMDQKVACFVVPEAKIIHVGGGSGSALAVKQFYESKYRYLRKFYGHPHVKFIYLLDRIRMLRKWFIYSTLAVITRSERIRQKEQYYKTAWKSTHSSPLLGTKHVSPSVGQD